jgi:competence protein ComEC
VIILSRENLIQLLLCSGIYFVWHKKIKHYYLFLLLVGSWIIFSLLFLYFKPPLKISVLDVGQGDSIVIQTQNHAILIDTGPRSFKRNAGRDVVYPWLKKLGIKSLDFLILTHEDLDHTGGFSYLKQNYKIHHLLKNSDSFEYKKLILDQATIEVLNPPFLDDNNHSLIVKVSYQSYSFLLMGDAEYEAEEWLMSYYPRFCKANYLKVGHHGSKTSSCSLFIQHVHPKAAIISVGAYNHFNHPHPDVLNTLSYYNIPIYRTDKMGSIQFVFKPTTYEINTMERNEK